MLGLNFIHAGFLAAGLAVALPVVIHLLFRQRTRTVPIGSVRFLHQVVREHRRRRRVRQWLLLALRMLSVLLLALLFARPYWDQSHMRGLEQELVVLVDDSASMQAQSPQRESAFHRATATARDELSHLDDNVIVHLALCDARGARELTIKELLNSTPTQAATDFGAALSWAKDVLSASNRKNRRIVLLTDLQRTGLPRTAFEQLPEGIDLVVRNVGDSLLHNVSIESAQAVRTEIRPDSQITVRAVVRNHGALAVRNLPVKCDVTSINNVHFKVDRQVDIPGQGTAVLEFPMAIENDGLYKGSVTVEIDDAMSFDNQRWIGFEARHPERILLVDGQEGRSIFSSETYFLETALRLQTEEAGGTIRSFEPDRIVWESGEGFPRLDGFRAVILANVRRLSLDDGARMEIYLRNGGSLLIFAGEQVSSTSLAVFQERGLLPGRVAESPVERRLRVDHWDETHPALSCFTDPQQGDLRRIEFQKLLPLKSVEPEARVLLSAGGLIVAAELTVGKGRCLFFGSTADRDWTELPRTPMYVPLMRQLLAYLTGQLSERSVVASGLVSKLHETAGITPVEGEEGRWCVTNIDSRESSLERITTEELRKLAGVTPEKNSDDNSSTADLKLPADSLRSDEIWNNVVWLLLAVLAAETLLAGRIHA